MTIIMIRSASASLASRGEEVYHDPWAHFYSGKASINAEARVSAALLNWIIVPALRYIPLQDYIFGLGWSMLAKRRKEGRKERVGLVVENEWYRSPTRLFYGSDSLAWEWGLSCCEVGFGFF